MASYSGDLDENERPSSHPARKRRRIALACTQCRSRKSKCDGVHPSCGYCSDVGLRCVYKHRERVSRPSGSGEYDGRLKAIEATLQQLLHARDDEPNPQSQSVSSTGVTIVDGNAHQERLGSDGESPLNQECSEPATDGLATVQGHCSQVQFFGPSSNIAFLKAVSRATSAILRVLAARTRLTRYHAQESLTRLPSPLPVAFRASGKSPSIVPGTSDVLPSEDEATRLLTLYFSNTGIMFPFLSEKQLFASLRSLRSQLSYKNSTSLCLLNAIFAFARIMEPKDKHLDAESTFEADIFYQRALSLMDLDKQTCSNVETVQYLVVLSLYCQISQRANESWKFHGLAIHAATQFGLFSPSVIRKFHGVEREVRKRLWYGCFILDRSLSMTLGRPPLIQSHLMSLEMPLDVILDEIGSDPRTVGSGKGEGKLHSAPFFIATIQLYKIQGSIIVNLYGHNVDEGLSDICSEMLKHIADIEENLENWKQSLPKSMTLRPWEDTGFGVWPYPEYDLVSARLSAVTHLRYLNARILLHRPVLQWLLERRRARPPNLANLADGFREMMIWSSVDICQDSAACIVDLIWRLSSTPDLLGARWFAVYFTFNAALVLFSSFLLDPVRHALGRKLSRAVEATEKLANESQASRRVLQILRKLIDISDSLGEFQSLVIQESDLHDARSQVSDRQSATRMVGQPNGVARTSDEGSLGAGLPGFDSSLDLMEEACSTWDPADLGVLWPTDEAGAEISMILGF